MPDEADEAGGHQPANEENEVRRGFSPETVSALVNRGYENGKYNDSRPLFFTHNSA